MNFDKLLESEFSKTEKLDSITGSSKLVGLLATKFLQTEIFSSTLILYTDPRSALTGIANALSQIGNVTNSAEATDNPVISVVVGSGFMNMNPCLVSVELTSFIDKKTTLVVAAAAKEGLIKQKTAEKAVMRAVSQIKIASSN